MSTEDIELNIQIKSNDLRGNLAADLEDQTQMDALTALNTAKQLDGLRSRLRSDIGQSTVQLYSININGVLNQFTNEVAKLDYRIDALDPATEQSQIERLVIQKDQTTQEYQDLLDMMYRQKHGLEDSIKNMQQDANLADESFGNKSKQSLSLQQKSHHYNNVTNNSRLEVVNLTQRKNEIIDHIAEPETL